MNTAIEERVLTDDDWKAAAGILFKAKKDEGYMPIALHPYRAADGSILYARVRMHRPDTSKPKGHDKLIRPFWHDGTRWVHGEPPQPGGKPLYGLQNLFAYPDASVVLCEGEQKADALTEIGAGQFIGITSGGATSAGGADWSPMEGRHVRIWPDNDVQGQMYADEVTAKLLALGCTVERIDVAALGLPPKGDVMDWRGSFKTTHNRRPTADDVLALPRVKATPAGIAASTADDWPEPQPLPDGTLAQVEPFDMELLPERLRPWGKDIAERMQCPPDFVGATIMAELGVVIGRRVGIRPKARDDWTEYANLWLCIVGRPAVMKSPSMAAALAPLKALQAKAQKTYDSEQKAYASESEIHAMRLDADQQRIKKALKNDPMAAVQPAGLEEPAQPILRRYLVDDATVEALLDICIENPQGVGIYRDELVGLLKGLDKVGQESARGFYLTGWNGNDSYSVDRIGRGRNLRAEAVCLSVMGSTQPGRVSEYLREAIADGAGNDGLIQRFGLITWPDIDPEWQDVDRWPDAGKKRAAFEVFERLAAADPVKDWLAEIVTDYAGQPVEGAPPYLRLSDDALELFRDWRQKWETDLRSGNLHPALESHFAKYRKLVPSLALICHLADDGKGCAP